MQILSTALELFIFYNKILVRPSEPLSRMRDMRDNPAKSDLLAVFLEFFRMTQTIRRSCKHDYFVARWYAKRSPVSDF